MDARLGSRLGAALGAATFVLTLLGCMNFAIGNRTSPNPDGVLDQEGDVHLSPFAEEDIYYPIPYANFPNVELTETFSQFQIIEQKEDHCRIRNTTPFRIDVHWHARGVRFGLLPPPPQPLVQSATPNPPSEPEPAN